MHNIENPRYSDNIAYSATIKRMKLIVFVRSTGCPRATVQM